MKQSDLDKTHKVTRTATGGLIKREDGGPGSGPQKGGGGSLREETKAKAHAAFKQDPEAAGRLHNQIKAYVPKDENQKTVLAATHAALAEHFSSKAYDQEKDGQDNKGYKSLAQEHEKASSNLDFHAHVKDMFSPPGAR